MFQRFSQGSVANSGVHFSNAMFGEVDHSRMVATPQHLTTFNAGELVPIYCREVLPDEDIDFKLDFVIRQNTVLTPTMGKMHVDIYAFFVPNRIVNASWKAVEGENYSGSWIAPEVSLAPLVSSSEGSVQIPVGSVADYYGFPTQLPMPKSVLSQCHDLKFRGYVMIWNEWFRDQNYQPPIPISYLNVYQGFLDGASVNVGLNGVVSGSMNIASSTVPDGSYGAGSVAHALYGSSGAVGTSSISPKTSVNSFRATSFPLRVNKLHDYFTSVLPSPQKGPSVLIPSSSTPGVSIPQVGVTTGPLSVSALSNPNPLQFIRTGGSGSVSPVYEGGLAFSDNSSIPSLHIGKLSVSATSVAGDSSTGLAPSNLIVPAHSGSVEGVSIDINDIRMSAAIQQYYETLARGGSRYRELVQSFFGIEVEDPYSDIPQCLGKISRDLDLFQTAQTSSSVEGSTPQGNLAAFGYTSSGGSLFKHKFIEHGYVHVFAVVRHKNVYPSYLARDNFRLNALDFYTPPMANISEQPVYQREINPFSSTPNNAFGYQEAWAEYRFEPDEVTGYMRPGVEGSLALWNYADNFDSGLTVADSDFMFSNSKEVLDRSLAVTSSVAPQLKAQFSFVVDKTLPMPTYSVPGMDII